MKKLCPAGYPKILILIQSKNQNGSNGLKNLKSRFPAAVGIQKF